MPEGQSGISGDPVSLEKAGAAAEGDGQQGRKQPGTAGKGLADFPDTGGDFQKSHQKCPEGAVQERDLVNPGDQDGEQHQGAADDHQGLAGGQDDLSERDGFFRGRILKGAGSAWPAVPERPEAGAAVRGPEVPCAGQAGAGFPEAAAPGFTGYLE